jgi:hypothetical protein
MGNMSADSSTRAKGDAYRRSCINMKAAVFSTEGHILLIDSSFRMAHEVKKTIRSKYSYPQCTAHFPQSSSKGSSRGPKGS